MTSRELWSVGICMLPPVTIHYVKLHTPKTQKQMQIKLLKLRTIGQLIRKWFLIGTIQVRSRVYIKQFGISLEEPNAIIHSGVVKDATLQSTVDYVGDQPIASRTISRNISLCRHIFPNHHIVRRRYGLSFSHPKPESRLKRNHWIVGHDFRIS